ncbi:hypothetical protein B566_EDAN005683 [Ephemera danica]|nr:hypothetical protein B566_EDAN005683 [Ephemera danica]
MHTPNLTQDNIARIRDLFPGCVTEARGEGGTVKWAVDFDQLRQELAESIVEGPQERYQLNWPGKREALLTANAPIAKTLRPCREESVDFDSTKNLFIEGDNLDALKLLQETYLGKVKMIYIDPPYNTGNDFIYEDDFAEETGAYLQRSNQKDEQGQRLVANTEANGRFHSDWLSMMYPRLKLARNLLRDDGVIFISIDDNEQASLKLLCDEIFGYDNFLSSIVWEKRFTRSNNSKTFATLTESVLCYRKSSALDEIKEPRNEKADSTYANPDNDPRGVWTSVSYVNPATKEQRQNLSYALINPFTKQQMEGGMVPVNFWDRKSTGTTDEASKNLESLLGGKFFDFPKPLLLIKRAANLIVKNGDIILDFFSGSATTAHAVMQLNAEDGGHRQFILVQLPEACDEKSEAFKAGYKTIAEIGKERIRRAGQKILADAALTPSLSQRERGLDVGFRVLKIDRSNMAEVYYTPDALEKANLDLFVNNIKPDRTPEDLLFQVMQDWGVDLTLPIAKQSIQGKEVLFVDGNALAACFDASGGIDEAFVKELAKQKPLRVVFRDAGYQDSAVKINVAQIFKLLSPATDNHGPARTTEAKRSEINTLLLDKLSEAIDAEQKETKIANLLTKLRRSRRITNTGSRGKPVWKLAE